MDPDECLARLREAADRYTNAQKRYVAAEAAREAVEAFHELDLWLLNGGFLPKLWRNGGIPPEIA